MAASPGLVLLGGDTFELQGDSEVKALVYGEFRQFSAASGGGEVAARPVGPLDPDDEAYFERFADFVAEPQRAPPDYGDRRTGDKVRRNTNIQPSPVAPPGRQLLLRDSRMLSLVWLGGPGQVRVKPSRGEARTYDSGSRAWIRVVVPPDADEIDVQLIDLPLRWSVEVAEVAKVEKLGGRRFKAEYAARTRWAHETLLAARPKYDELRVLALSVLAEEAQPRTDINNEFARLAWIAAINGRMIEQIGTQPR